MAKKPTNVLDPVGFKKEVPRWIGALHVGFRVFGVGAAYLFHKHGDEARAERGFALVRDWNAGGAFAFAYGCYLLSWVGGGLNVKLRVDAGARWPNDKVLKTADGQVVLMDNDGAAGKFNRSGRAYANALEYMPFALVMGILATVAFPKAAKYSGLVWLIGRAIYLIGYTADEKLRLPGFLVSNIALTLLEGMTAYTAWQTL